MKEIVATGGGTTRLDTVRVFTRNDYDVVTRDIRDEIIQTGEARLNKDLDRLMSKGKLDKAKKAEILSHVSFTTELVAAVDADLAVEAAIENLNIKKSIFTGLDSLCKLETVLASNASSVSVTIIAVATKRADKFAGMHFFNPATVTKLVEAIRGTHTSDEIYKTIAELAVAIGKEPAEVNEAPGFVVNKILVLMINEGIDLVYTGVASMRGMDTVMKLGANHLMGPPALGDLIGLDVCLTVMDILYDETHDPKYHVPLLLRRMVCTGKLGRKTSIDFYDYSKK